MAKILILFFQSLTAHVTMNKIPCALPRVDWRPSLIQEKSDSRSFTAVWLCLFLFSGLFALLQAFILPSLHPPQGVMFMLCSCLAASPILCYGSRIGVWRLYPVTGTQRPPGARPSLSVQHHSDSQSADLSVHACHRTRAASSRHRPA